LDKQQKEKDNTRKEFPGIVAVSHHPENSPHSSLDEIKQKSHSRYMANHQKEISPDR
jgi:hypothetical protein